jgi:hypothetical protein
MILERQDRAGWGAKVIDRLAADLREAFPDMKGFSPRNIKYARLHCGVTGVGVCARGSCTNPVVSLHRPVGEAGDPAERLWYASQAKEHGWSHNIMVLQIQSRAHERHGKAIGNFKTTLPPAESDLAEQAFKDPYLFDFLGTKCLSPL